MTREEVVKVMDENSAKRNVLTPKIVAAARAIVPVLLDAGRLNSAKELQELLFELDAIDQAMHEFVQNNLSAALEAVAMRLERER